MWNVNLWALLLLFTCTGKVGFRGPEVSAQKGLQVLTSGCQCELGSECRGRALTVRSAVTLDRFPIFSKPQVTLLMACHILLLIVPFLSRFQIVIIEGSYLCCDQISLCIIYLLVLGLPSVAIRPPLSLLPS